MSFCELQEKSVLVTGASSGIGMQAAISISQQGGKLIITGRNEEKLKETMGLLEGSGHQMIAGDLIVEEDRDALLNILPELDGVVHCAGIVGPTPAKYIRQDDIKKIAATIGCSKVTLNKDTYRLKIINNDDDRELVLEIYPETSLGKNRGVLIVVYTGNSHLQLHNCTGYVVSEELGEVTFVAETNHRLSGLVVEQGASASLYAALDRELISSDFSQLGVEVMLSGVALSLAEDILSKEKEDNSE